MKINIITCHNVYNYGASLQAYALMHFLEMQGHNVAIIDYLPYYKVSKYTFQLEKNGVFGTLARLLPMFTPFWCKLRYRNGYKFLGRKKAFDTFQEDYLKITPQLYVSISDFNIHPLSADLYIAGSDQIWNPYYGNGLDPVYYCGFEKNPNKCISYAASFGVVSIDARHLDFIKSNLANFKALAIREKSGVNLAASLGFKATNVCDPVFLLNAEQWETLCRTEHKGKYLLLYDFHNDNPQLKEVVLKIAKEKRLRIVSINDEIKIPYADENINNAGPLEFIEYIKNSEFIVASSFHATAFAVIFHKDFYTFPLEGHQNSSRMTDFLSMLGLMDRFTPTSQGIHCLHIDYSEVDCRMQSFIESSKAWLICNTNK